MKIMIVDDSSEIRDFLKSILQGAGVEFVECGDGGEAIARFAALRPDWTLMDVRMKPVDGLTATRDITGRFPDSRILIITQDGNPRLKAAALSAGATEFLLKDDLSSIRQIIRTDDL
jgi:CheY-like chemotaxis protein